MSSMDTPSNGFLGESKIGLTIKETNWESDF